MIGIMIAAITAVVIIGMAISNYRYTQRLKSLYIYKTDNMLYVRTKVDVNTYYIAAKLTGYTGTKYHVSGRKIGYFDHWIPASEGILMAARCELVAE